MLDRRSACHLRRSLHTLRQDGARKVEDSHTTIEEVLRVTQQ